MASAEVGDKTPCPEDLPHPRGEGAERAAGPTGLDPALLEVEAHRLVLMAGDLALKHQETYIDGVPEEDSGKGRGGDGDDARLLQGDGRLLPRRPAAEIRARDDDRTGKAPGKGGVEVLKDMGRPERPVLRPQVPSCNDKVGVDVPADTDGMSFALHRHPPGDLISPARAVAAAVRGEAR